MSPAAGLPGVSPLACRLAEEEGIDLARVVGTGPRGQITREDIETALGARRGSSRGDAARGDERFRRAAAGSSDRNHPLVRRARGHRGAHGQPAASRPPPSR